MPGVRALLTQATARLAAAGVPSPRVDAELLLAAVLDVPRTRLVTHGDVPAATAERYAGLVDRRAAREPLQHITGTAPFRHLLLGVGPGVFVPRPETELLVDAVLPFLRRLDRPVVVDLCAGSGALGLAVLDEVPGARVVAVERSPAAVRWLTGNAAGTGLQIVVADVGNPDLLTAERGRVDVVLCNPPYVPGSTAVDPEVRADPHEAVFAGPTGLDLMSTVSLRAAELLRPNGLFAVEHDAAHGRSVPELLVADGRWATVTAHRDLAGQPRFAVATRR